MINLFLMIACSELKDTGQEEMEGISLSSGIYQLDWSAGSQDVYAFPLENNLGYQISIQKGYLSSYSVRFYPCVDGFSSKISLPISSAFAGHSDILVAGNWSQPWVENLLGLEEVVQEKSFAEHVVCSLVYTIARADGSSQNLPIDIDLNNLSLYIEGSWQKDDEAGDFIWESNLPAERVFPLKNCVQAGENIHSKSMKIQLTRDISRAFDDIDFVSEDSQRGALQLITNIVQDTMLTCWKL